MNMSERIYSYYLKKIIKENHLKLSYNSLRMRKEN